jgi:hypothetical protein
LIDRTAGSKLILQLPHSSSSGPIIDLAVTETLVAVVGHDHSVTVYQVPRGWDRDDPRCDLVNYLPPGHDADGEGIGMVDRVEWINRSNGEALVLAGREGVVVVDLGQLKKASPGSDVASIVAQSKVLKTDGVSFG